MRSATRIGNDFSPSSWSSHQARQRESTWTPSPSAAARATIDERAAVSRSRPRPSRRTPGTRGSSAKLAIHGTNDSARACRNRLPSTPRPPGARGRSARRGARWPRRAGTTSRNAHVSANHTVPGSSRPEASGLSGRRRASRSRSDEVVGPAQQRLADQHRGGDEADLAQRSSGDGGGGAQRGRGHERLARVGRPDEEQRRGCVAEGPEAWAAVSAPAGGSGSAGSPPQQRVTLSSPHRASDLHKRGWRCLERRVRMVT